LDGLSYHNVRGDFQDALTLKEAKRLISNDLSLSSDMVFNSEWAWWPFHDTDHIETALRVARILYLQALGGAYASLYLGPAQPKNFKKGLGVLKFNPKEPDSAEKTSAFYAFNLMIRGILQGRRLRVMNPLKKLKVLALYKDSRELVITLLNSHRKEYKNVSLMLEKGIGLKENSWVKIYKFDQNQVDYSQESQYNDLKKFNIQPKSITQFVIPIGRLKWE